MAAFSLGKLDAICARLKSSQQSSVATDCRRDNGRAQNVQEEVQPSCYEVRKCVTVGKNELQRAEEVLHARDKLQLASLQQTSQDGCKDLEVSEKIKVQSTVGKPSLKDDSIIDKDNSTNNNCAEATDYNNEIDTSFQSTTFQTADSTTNADSCVSSTTAEPVLCNEYITIKKFCPIAAPLAKPQQCSDPVSDGKPERESLLRLHPQLSLPSAAALFPSPDSLCERNLFLQLHKKSSSEPSYGVLDTGHFGGKNIAGQVAVADCQINSVVTSTQGPLVGKGGNIQKLQPKIKAENESLLPSTSLCTVSSNHFLFPPVHCELYFGKDTQRETCIVSKAERNMLYNGEHKKPDVNSGHVLLTVEDEGPVMSQVSSKGTSISGVSVPVLNTEKHVTPFEKSSSQSLPSSSSHELPGRRKSRKSTKPQKQVTNKTYIDLPSEGEAHFENTDHLSAKEQNIATRASSSIADKHLEGTEPNQTTSSDSQNKNPVSENYTFAVSPLDLSVANSSSKSPIQPPAIESFEKANILCSAVGESAACEPAQIVTKPNFKDTAVNENNSALKRTSIREEQGSSNSPQLETSDSIVLVDFANNTMKELLGIYGFDGQDAKTISLNNVQNFQSDNLTQFSTVSDKKSSLPSVVKSEEVQKRPTKKSKNKTVKSGAFQRNVYTSLTQRASTSYNSSASTSSSDTQETLSFSDTSQVPATRTVRYAFSKKSYTQKVLNSSDFTKYIKRYGTGADCGGKVCLDLGYRDHYHCLDCPQKVFIRKEETVRHYKWHKKRNDSLQHGFMRYSPMDDCSKKHGNCTHNGRQTHYHCVQGDCDKVYVSTSDVQMHANFHRKDSAIIQEGFQRFRATEDCGTTSCSFYGQRTTHFHCRRPHCNFTFKNKADMEKHKSYHQKDEVLSRDGFKKFMKYETCSFSGCRYSKISNHIHCIRPGCQYVLHSTAQLYSHKRKHERREFDHAYRTFRNLQQKVPSTSVKKEGLNGKNSPSLAHTSVSQTKILPLPASAVAKLRMVPEMSGQTAANDSKQVPHVKSMQIGNSTSVSLVNNTIRKPVLDLSFPLPGSLMLAGKTLPHIPHAKDEILNLTGRGGEGKKDKEELRQTLTLPIKLSGGTFQSSTGGNKLVLKSEVDNERFLKQEPKCEIGTEAHTSIVELNDEPQDLSMPKKEKNSKCFEDGSLKVDTSFKSEPDSDSLPQMSETFDDDDEDDDDDDDDKDYGQVEEPTLVNTFSIALEGDKLNDSLNLAIPKQEGKQSREVIASSGIGLEGGAVRKLMTQGVNTSLVKVASAVSEPDKKVTSLSDLHDQHSQQFPQGAPRAILTSKGKVLGVHIPVRLLPERRERDESWKRYLIRYTANDACFSRCSCLYKDHYHCRAEGCQIVFKSKDGVRGHARFHELQDSITPLVYLHFKSSTPCNVSECPYGGKEEHYHCNWTNCSKVMLASAATFTRLEHYRTHEYATVAANKNRTNFSGPKAELDPLQKRRGRPPKYPKYDLPVVPKVHLTEKEILDSTLAFLHNKCSEDSKIFNGFKKCVASDPCPDNQCIYKGKDHFHCGRKYCHMSTDRLDVLNLHAKDFHNNITILDGYEFFERTVNCRRPVCHNNKINRHFHCMRPHCDYSFVRHSTMSQHNKKHPTVTSAVLSVPVTKATPTPSTKVVSSQFVPIAPAVAQTTSTPSTPTVTSPNCSKTVKSSGTFFPLSGVSSFKMSSLSSPSISSSQVITSGTTGPLLSSTPLTLGGASPTQIITGAQVFHAQDGTAIFSPGTLLTLPHNLISTSIPLLTSAAHGQQANLLTGIIPVGQLSQHGLATPLVSISGGQLITASQGHVLQSRGILGGGVFQVIQSPTTITTLTTSTPAPISTSATSSATAIPSTTPPLTVLLHQQQQQLQEGMSTTVNWASLKRRMHYSVDLNCGRPFCKLKKKDHYHCLDCNQAFSFSARLRAHISKHGFQFKKPELKAKPSISPEFQDEGQAVAKPMDLSLETEVSASRIKSKDVCAVPSEELSSSLNLQPSVFTSMVKQADLAGTDLSYMNGNANRVPTKLFSNTEPQPSTCHKGKEASDVEDNDMEDLGVSQMSNVSDSKYDDRCLDSPSLIIDDVLDDSYESSLDASSSSLTLCLSLSRKSSRKRVASKNDDFVCTSNLLIPKPAKKKKMQWGVRNESDLPEGFKRVRCGEDCGHVRCAYRQTVTHFHCVRSDCGYGFSDKSRIIQHRIRHERLDALMGGEFQQYRASVSCDRADCEFDEKASHFHCLKCPYSCADSSKVPAHRKYHTKLDNISSNGFIKYAGSADCQTAACSYFRKQTHYHCTFPGCGHSVLGPSQMAPHKLKHAQHQSV